MLVATMRKASGQFPFSVDRKVQMEIEALYLRALFVQAYEIRRSSPSGEASQRGPLFAAQRVFPTKDDARSPHLKHDKLIIIKAAACFDLHTRVCRLTLSSIVTSSSTLSPSPYSSPF